MRPPICSFEAYWSIHLVGGEESHTARPLVLQGTTEAPGGLTATVRDGSAVELAWTAPLFPPPVTGYVVERAADEGFTEGVQTFTVAAGAATLHGHDRAERRHLLLPRPHRGGRRLVAVVGGRRGEPALMRRPGDAVRPARPATMTHETARAPRLDGRGGTGFTAGRDGGRVHLPEVLMGVAAGIGILAALSHGLVGFSRRPRDKALIAFAIAAAATAAGALSVLALYTIEDIGLHVAVMKYAYFPADVVCTVATVWFVAFVADVRPMRFLYAVTAGFAFTLVVDLVLANGILHEEMGGLMQAEALGSRVMVMTQSSPHVLQNVTDALTLVAFAFMCYAVFRVYRRPAPDRARYLGLMTALLAVATLLDAINEHRIVISLNTLYLSQIAFALVIIAVSLVLRRESLGLEMELQKYRTHMDETRRRSRARARRGLRAPRAGGQGAARHGGGAAPQGGGAGRPAAHGAGPRGARHARRGARRGDRRHRRALQGELRPRAPADRRRRRRRRDRAGRRAGAGRATGPAGDDGARPLTALDLAVTGQAMRDDVMIAADVAAWPDLPEDARRQAAAEGLGHVLAAPLAADLGPGRGARHRPRRATAGRSPPRSSSWPRPPATRSPPSSRSTACTARRRSRRPPRSARRWRATCTTP